MAKPMKTLESHYPMIQFLIFLIIIHQIILLARDWPKPVMRPNIPPAKTGEYPR